MKTKKTRAPIEARRFGQICQLPRDNLTSGDFWIMVDVNEVAIHEQKTGEYSKQKISIDRRAFDKFVRWYMTGDPKKSTVHKERNRP